MKRGTVLWFDVSKGYGFIKESGGTDLFCHYSDIAMDGFKVLRHGQVVEYDVGKNHAGRDKAIMIRVVE